MQIAQGLQTPWRTEIFSSVLFEHRIVMSARREERLGFTLCLIKILPHRENMRHHNNSIRNTYIDYHRRIFFLGGGGAHVARPPPYFCSSAYLVFFIKKNVHLTIEPWIFVPDAMKRLFGTLIFIFCTPSVHKHLFIFPRLWRSHGRRGVRPHPPFHNPVNTIRKPT